MVGYSESTPRGRTAWEMFRGWLRKKFGAEPSDQELPAVCQNLLDWPPGLPVEDPDLRAAFPDSLIRLETITHVVRPVMGQPHHFADYTLKITPRDTQQAVRVARYRRSLDGPALLLHPHDEFGFAQDFIDLLNDPSGIFQIDDDPNGLPARFERLHGLQGPWKAGVYVQGDADQDGNFDTINLPFHEIEYWDYLRACADGREEYLFVEIHQTTGWIQIWRGFLAH
jgi:hypothetical protein